MAYLLPAGMPSRTKNKWGLGLYRTRAMRSRGLSHWKNAVQAHTGPGMGHWKNYAQAHTGPGMGQDDVDDDFAPARVAVGPGGAYVPGSPDYGVPGVPPNPPSQPGVNPAIQQAYKNLLSQQQASQDPLDYVSPQAAIAAGLDPTMVYAAWSKGLARFPTQNAAINAGIPAGVVTQLWQQSRTAMPTTSTTFGVPTQYLIFGGGALALFALMRGRR
jgi:hypothetical protein